jgi:hypothetical protein
MVRAPSSAPLRQRPPAWLAAAAAVVAGLLGSKAPAAETEVDGVTVRITKSDCARLVKHRPDPGVAYRPGVDVHGDPVAPADLHGRPDLNLPERVEIPIEVELDARYGLPPDASFEGDVAVGTVTVDLKTGRARFNGRPLTADDEAALRARCEDILDAGTGD